MKKIKVEFKDKYSGQSSSIEVTDGLDKVRIYDNCINYKLEYLRKKYGLTQQNVADVLGISKVEYWRMEKTGYTPNPQRVQLLAYFYNVTLDSLYDMYDENQDKELRHNTIFTVNGYSLNDFIEKKKEG